MDSLNKLSSLNMLLSSMSSQPVAASQQQQQQQGLVKLPGGLTSLGLGATMNAQQQQQQQQLLGALGLSAQPLFNLQAAQSQIHAQPLFNLGVKRPAHDEWMAQQQQRQVLHKTSSDAADHAPASAAEEAPKGSSRRRSSQQLEVLEFVFKLCPTPTEARRKQLGQMLKMDERQVVIWFQNKRQRVRAKMKEQENNTLRQQHSALKSELQREKARERALEQENALLKSWMKDKVKKMEEARQASKELLVEYYKEKGVDAKSLPAGLAEALKLPEKAGEGEDDKGTTDPAEAMADGAKPKADAEVDAIPASPKTPLNRTSSGENSGEGHAADPNPTDDAKDNQHAQAQAPAPAEVKTEPQEEKTEVEVEEEAAADAPAQAPASEEKESAPLQVTPPAQA